MVVRCGGSNDEAIHFLRVCPCFFKELSHGFASHITGSESFFVEDAAFFDSDAGHNPFIVRVNHSGEFFVVEHVFGDISSDSGDDGVDFFHEESLSATCCFVA